MPFIHPSPRFHNHTTMSGFSLKGGWHPTGKDGKKEGGIRSDFKGVNQIAGWMGKGKDTQADKDREEHVSRPLHTLKDRTQVAVVCCEEVQN